MNIKINNAEQAVSTSEELTSNSIALEQVNETIKGILSELGAYWEQTQQDAQKFSKDLKKDTKELEQIVECNKEFATNVMNYARVQERTSKRTAA